MADIVTENDLRALALGLEESERRGKKLLYRVGPPFVRARIGQEIRTQLTGAEAYAGNTPSEAGGLIVVGSHVGQTTRQLKVADSSSTARRASSRSTSNELLAAGDDAQASLTQIVATVVEALRGGDVIVHTSRLLIKAGDPDRKPADRANGLSCRRGGSQQDSEDLPAAVRHRQGRDHVL